MQRRTLPDRIVTSLVKQWLHHMQQGSDDARQRFHSVKRINDLDQLLEGLHCDRQAAPAANVSEPA